MQSNVLGGSLLLKYPGLDLADDAVQRNGIVIDTELHRTLRIDIGAGLQEILVLRVEIEEIDPRELCHILGLIDGEGTKDKEDLTILVLLQLYILLAEFATEREDTLDSISAIVGQFNTLRTQWMLISPARFTRRPTVSSDTLPLLGAIITLMKSSFVSPFLPVTGSTTPQER